jgi:PTH1 family peptidyl-tRNA hydrolase
MQDRSRMNAAGLIVGLGNPGREYAHTRHNLGFMFVDLLLRRAADRYLPVTELAGGAFRCRLWKIVWPGNRPWLALQPQTFMNLSGECVQPVAAWYRIPPSRIFVVHDELDLPCGRMRCKTGGGNAGHNGLISISRRLGTPDFYRLRLGIGRPPPDLDAAAWVLGRFSQDDLHLCSRALEVGFEVACAFIDGDPAAAIRLANSFRAED